MTARTAAWHVGLVVACVAQVFPLAWAVLATLRPTADFYTAGPVPAVLTLEQYRSALHGFPLLWLLLRTTLSAGTVTAADAVLAVLAAYALVRLPLRRRRAVLTLFTVALLIPAQTLIVPQFLAVARLGWINTLAGLVVPQLGGVGLAVLLLRQHVAALPPSLFAAARLDGATPLDTVRSVVAPLLAPAIGAVSVLVFVTSWNEYLWPTLVAPAPDQQLIQPGLVSFTNAEGANPGPLLAAAIVATLPVLVAYAVAARRISGAFAPVRSAR